MKAIVVICLALALSMGDTMAQGPKDKEEFRQLFNLFRGNGTDEGDGSGFSILNIFRGSGGDGDGDGEGSGSSILGVFRKIRNLFRSGEDDGEGSGSSLPSILRSFVELFRRGEDDEEGLGSSIRSFFRSLTGRRRRSNGEVDGGSDAEVLSSLRMPGTGRGFDIPKFAVRKMIKIFQERFRGGDGFERAREFFLEIYGEMCCSDNCKENARTCMNAIKPPMELTTNYEECMPVVFDSIREQKNPMPAVVDCAMGEILTAMELPYTAGDIKTNAETYLKATVLNNTDLNGAGSEILASVGNGVCVPATMEDFKMTDHIKFKMCLLNTCVNAMAAA